MTAQTVTPANAEALTTPNDADGVKPKKRKRQRRYQLFDDGQGDYRIYEIAQPGGSLPQGSLVPIPGMSGYPNAIEARRAIRTSGDLLANKHVMIFRGLEIMRITVETRPTVSIESKPRRQISGLPVENAKA